MGELLRLFRTLKDNPRRIAEGPDWLRQKFYIWRSRRRGPSGYVSDAARTRRLQKARPRYDHLRMEVMGGASAFPEVRPERLPSPDEGLDLVFASSSRLSSRTRDRIRTAQGFLCIPSEEGWQCETADGDVRISVRERETVDLSDFNPIGRSVDTNLIRDLEETSFEAGELRKLAAVRIPMTVPPADHVGLAIRALACGTPVVVSERSPVAKMSSTEGVFVIPDEAPLTVGRLGFDQPFAYERASASAHRAAFWGHASFVVADEYVKALGFRVEPLPSVSIVLVTRRPDLVIEALGATSVQKYENREVVVGLHGADPDDQLVRDIEAACPEVSSVQFFSGLQPFGEVLDTVVDVSSGRLVAKFDDDDWYSEHHLSDLVAAWMLTRADVVGKTANFAYLETSDQTLGYDDELQYRRVEHIPGGTMLAPRDLLIDYRFGRSTRAIDSVLLRKVRADAGYLYSTTRQGFMRRRHRGHTAGFDDEWFIRRAHGRTLPGLRLDLAGLGAIEEAEAPGNVHHG